MIPLTLQKKLWRSPRILKKGSSLTTKIEWTSHKSPQFFTPLSLGSTMHFLVVFIDLSYLCDSQVSQEHSLGCVPKNENGSLDLETLSLHLNELGLSYNRLKSLARWILCQMHISHRKINRLEAVVEEQHKLVDQTSECKDEVQWEVG